MLYNIQTLENVKELDFEKKSIVYNDNTELSFESITKIAQNHLEMPTILWFTTYKGIHKIHSLTKSKKIREAIEFYKSHNKGQIIKESFKCINYE